jgi:hypothetical protein
MRPRGFEWEAIVRTEGINDRRDNRVKVRRRIADHIDRRFGYSTRNELAVQLAGLSQELEESHC